MPFPRSFSLLPTSGSELRLAVRFLRKQPIVTLTTVLALTVGIGMATAGFTLLDSVLYSKLPFPNGDRFVLLDAFTEPDARRTTLGAERFRSVADHAAAFEHLGAFQGAELNLSLSSGEILPVRGASITPDSVAVFPYAPVLGRIFDKRDGARGAAPVALVRESLWRRSFSADPGIVGTIATFSGVKRTIVGVMPDAFEFPTSGEVWIPLGDAPESSLTWASARTFGVLRPDREVSVANAQLTALTKQFEAEAPSAPRLRVVAMHFTDAVSRGLGVLASLLVGSLVLVLIVIAANIANLVLARTFSRSQELAVRTALGASRGRLIGQIFTEVLLLGAISGAIGLATSQAVLTSVRQNMTDMPFWVDFSASPRTMVFAVFATVLVACVGGILPAIKATRRDTAAALTSASRASSPGLGPVGGFMVAMQVALSIALLNGALLMARGVAGYMNPSFRVPPAEVLTARIGSETAAPSAIVEAAAAIPGVTAAGISTSLPGLSPSAEMTIVEPIAGEPAALARPAPVVAVGGGFFETFGARADAGRLFGPGDFVPDASPVAVVNEPFVRKFLGGANPLGRRVRTIPAGAGASPGAWHEIVGVVPDLGLSAGDENMAAGFYVPLESDQWFHLALRTSGDARRLASPLRSAIDRIDPDIQVRDVQPADDVGCEDRAFFAVMGAALAALGGISLLLSVIGTYAILSLSVTRRTREIGIRSALGASRRQVLQSIMGKTCLPPAIGAALGIALGEALVAVRGIFAFRLPDGSGPWGLPVLAALMIAAGLLSAWVPARRALAVAPADALRME